MGRRCNGRKWLSTSSHRRSMRAGSLMRVQAIDRNSGKQAPKQRELTRAFPRPADSWRRNRQPAEACSDSAERIRQKGRSPRPFGRREDRLRLAAAAGSRMQAGFPRAEASSCCIPHVQNGGLFSKGARNLIGCGGHDRANGRHGRPRVSRAAVCGPETPRPH